MKTFTAEYHGTCAKCTGHISPGQEAAYGAFDELVHVDCPPDTSSLVRPPCSTCYEELPVTGVCGNCA